MRHFIKSKNFHAEGLGLAALLMIVFLLKLELILSLLKLP